jgi:hypothetical protein
MVSVNGEIVVREGAAETLPSTLISVSDPDTPTENLVFVLDTPPTFGFLEAKYSKILHKKCVSSSSTNFFMRSR